MPKEQTLFLFFLLIQLSSIFAATISSGKQIENLSYLFKNKLLRDSEGTVDTRPFSTSDINFHDVKIEIQEGLKEKDLIERLPGQPHDDNNIDFKQYGGYVTVDRVAGRAFYYYFVEAKRSNKSPLPLLLWLNGGPGCSSFGNGAMQELGPFRVMSDGKTLYRNKFAWNMAANVLFLESPAGVGFSYSNTTADFTTGGDRQTTIDNYAFLLNWLERFPEYKDRDFYISGESYTGHYGTLLAQTILQKNKGNKTLVNLKGVIIGNPSLDSKLDNKGMYEYFRSHALISNETADKIMKHCEFPINLKEASDECKVGVQEYDTNMAGINMYNIYAPICLNSSLTPKPSSTSGMSIDPCLGDYVHAYLNRAEVQEALHANVTKLSYEWSGCSSVIKRWMDSPSDVTPIIKNLLDNGLRVWIYSGDVDGRIPVTSTKLSIQKLELRPKSKYLPWYLGGQVGGYTQEYEGNLRYATVRGAGHQVPSYQPARALSLILHFLAGKDFPIPKH